MRTERVTIKQGNQKNLDFQKLGAAGLRAFFNIMKAWSVKENDAIIILGGVPRSTYYKWKQDTEKADLSRDTLERISYILGIYKALQVLLPQQEAADSWVNKANTAHPFNGKTALTQMLSGNVVDLYSVRQYLDAERGGWA